MTVGGMIEEVEAWHKETFPSVTMADCLDKLKEEVSELEDSIGLPNWPEELADVALVVFALAGRYGVDLEKEMRVKFAVNKQRGIEGRWKQ